MNVSHEMGSNLNISPKNVNGVLECDIVKLQNYMLMGWGGGMGRKGIQL